MEGKAPFVEFLEELVQDEHLTIRQFADIINCDVAAVRRWLYGVYKPTANILIRIATKFNVSVDYMFNLADSKELKLKKFTSSFYERYCTLRDRNHMNDLGVSVACGISDSTISDWKYIKSFPETDSLLKLAECFSCRLDYLLGIG